VGVSWLVCECRPLLARLRQRALHINSRESVAQMRCVDAAVGSQPILIALQSSLRKLRRVPPDLNYLSSTIVRFKFSFSYDSCTFDPSAPIFFPFEYRYQIIFIEKKNIKLTTSLTVIILLLFIVVAIISTTP